ncbi:MAG: hypothetical protein MJY64_02055 [archaeon]|nr:hypothetical protein [archaeon]
MRRKGFQYETTESIRKFRCPYCGFEFSLLYARTFACQGCSEALKSCPKVRCGKCDTEFFIKEIPRIGTEYMQKSMADHVCEVVDDYRKRYGYVGNR